jgi:hypothetical protein
MDLALYVGKPLKYEHKKIELLCDELSVGIGVASDSLEETRDCRIAS